MGLVLLCRGRRVAVWHALRGDVAEDVIGQMRDEGDLSIWIDPGIAVGSPEWVGTLAHEAVHAASRILREEGPHGEEALAELVGEIVEGALARIGEVERVAHYDETFHQQAERLLERDDPLRAELGLDDDEGGDDLP